MKKSRFSTVFFCHDDIRWVKDVNKVVVVSDKLKAAYVLDSEVDILIWEYLVLGYDLNPMIAQISSILDLSELDTFNMLMTKLKEWEKIGILGTRVQENG